MRRLSTSLLPFFTSVLALAISTAAPAADGPKPNPFLSAPVYGVTHFNPAQTDTLPYVVPRGEYRVDLSKAAFIPGGPINLMTLAATKPGFMWAISTDRVVYVDARAKGWKAVAELDLPGVKRVPPAQIKALLDPSYKSVGNLETLAKQILGPLPQAVTDSGLYTVVDRDNVAYVNAGTTIVAIGLRDPAKPAAGLEVKRSIDAKEFIPPMELPGFGKSVRLIGMNMTYDGRLIVGSAGAVAVIDRQFKEKASVFTIEAGQLMSNSFSVDDRNGVYIASGSLTPKGDGVMRKLVWTGKKLSDAESDGAWSSPYEGGAWPPAVKAGTGTGSTPTLMGFGRDKDKLVVITDGNDRMKIVAFWRDAIPADFQHKPGLKSRRIAGQVQVTAGQPDSLHWVQSEQSVVVNGYGAFVVNNVTPDGHPDKMVDVLANGPLIKPAQGVERFQWDTVKREWRSVWTRPDAISISMVPVASAPSRMVFVNGYSKADGWEVTGFDWETGKTVHRTIFGQSNYGNGAYAILQFLPDGDLLFDSVGGPFRVPLRSR